MKLLGAYSSFKSSFPGKIISIDVLCVFWCLQIFLFHSSFLHISYQADFPKISQSPLFMKRRNEFRTRRGKYLNTNRTITLSFFSPAFSWQNNEFLSLSRVRPTLAVAPDTSTSITARAKPAEKPITPLSVYTGSRLYARPRNVFPLRPRMQRETRSYPRRSGRPAFGEKLPKKPRVAVDPRWSTA